jgi:hypothetical protein
MKIPHNFIGLTSALLLTACSSGPIETSPDSSNWRLQNFLDNGLSETLRVYNFCYKGKESNFVSARDFEDGSHTIVTRITQHFNRVESKPRDAFTVLRGNFESGKTYVFQNSVEENKATLWIADIETGDPVTSKETVKLTVLDVVNNQQYKNKKCEISTL